MHKIRLPQLTLDLPEIATEESRAFFENITRDLEHYCKRAGKNSGAYRERRDKLLHVGLAGNDITALFDGPAYIRPLVDLWTNEPAFLIATPPDTRIINALEQVIKRTPNKRVGRLALREIFQLFFQHFDQMGEGLEAYCKFAKGQIKRFPPDQLMFGMDKLLLNANKIISPEGHRWLVRETGKTGKTLPASADRLGIPTTQSRFYDASQNIYYLERIKGLTANEDDKILDEVRTAKVHRAPYQDNLMIGHPIIETLIDKLSRAGFEPSDLWLKTILAIAGDPRVPFSHQNFRQWWSKFGNHRIALMRSWLSKMDMELFLDIVKEFSERKGGEDMRRMFPKRKKFLEGLFKNKLVQDAQLFLGVQPEEYLKSRFTKDEQPPHFIRLSGSNSNKLTVFYFRMGDVHLIEGTHSFALTIADKLPDECPAGKYEKTYAYSRPLGIGLQENYEDQFGISDNFARIIHNGNWPRKAYKQLKRLGIEINPSDIMEREDYVRMIRS
jgi:hypothetical protein